MNNESLISNLVQAQKQYFHSGATRSIEARINQLQKLRDCLIKNEQAIMQALKTDLNKSAHEAFSTEIGMVYKELAFTIKHLPKWAKPRRAATPLTHFGSKSRIYPEPYGTALIISPWNYPYQLAISPLIGAIAAGNTAILKPSELSPATSSLLQRILSETFNKELVAVIEGDADTSTLLLKQPLDYIFFTGSVPVGKIIMEAASKQLIPVTLELGGKSPCIVHEDAKLALAAKRIVFGKYTNAGQTCIAPDYLFVHASVKDQLIEHMKQAIAELYGPDPLTQPDYGRIISERHYTRLKSMLEQGTIAVGGRSQDDQLTIEPTILEPASLELPLMQEEIFGPLLPVLTYQDISEVTTFINSRPKPLALYLFSESRSMQETIIEQTSFGGASINDTLMHIASPYLPFGGVGESGIGAYHGQASFDCFSHQKSVLKQTTAFDFSFRYPNAKNGLAILRRFMKP